MNRFHYFLFPLFLILLIGCSQNQHSNHEESPYAGQQSREIKALTTQEVDGYLSGMGMGLSKVAELNHYPGPKHVLELANRLELSNQQKKQTEALFHRMKKKATAIGETYIAKERELNRLFESGEISSATVDSLLIEIGRIKGRLRSTHVNAHIKMEEVLTSDQIKKYDQLRGYGAGTSNHQHQQHS